MPLRTHHLLALLAVVGGSTIGFKLALPGSDSTPVAASAENPAGPAPPFTFAPPGGRRVAHSMGLDTGGQSTPGLRRVSAVQGESFRSSETPTPYTPRP
ncbi:MAG: hypothetical protein H0W90_00205 [Actinobacteria bacterium]|nr:hypothetical protein [Actinomycetota bacterium]